LISSANVSADVSSGFERRRHDVHRRACPGDVRGSALSAARSASFKRSFSDRNGSLKGNLATLRARKPSIWRALKVSMSLGHRNLASPADDEGIEEATKGDRPHFSTESGLVRSDQKSAY
jgi:hypothetical protein